MEVFGWHKEGEVLGAEIIFIFNKLYKKAIISMRPDLTKRGSTLIVISLYTVFNKQDDPENDHPVY
jgi:hypothetical protein